ncbi:MFS transporter [Clostridium sp. 'deep sea']|uniref:MFS transporter n=1 Tax=Clostridium sp. 'deep sea' TaxID=2779445 RepID=UPI0018966B38|nr:MFS transporter [Clostridium sp. 'deep sea']QOR33977.1 MFS transporter [Clostridium sp. 'deep sea']
MPLWKRNLYVLWLGCVIGGIAFSLVSPFLPMLLQEVGTTDNIEFLSGLAFGVTFITGAIMGPIWGTLADKYGRKPQIFRAGLGIGLVYILMAFSQNAVHIILARLLLGVFNGFIPSAIAMVATNTPEEELGGALGIINTGYSFGAIAGPMVGGYMSHYFGLKQTLIIAGLVLFAATFVIIFGTKEENKGDRTVQFNVVRDIKESFSYKILAMMFVVMMIYNLSLMIVQPILPLMVQKLAISGNSDPKVMTGLIFSLAGFATVMGAPYWGKYGQKHGYKKAMTIGLIGGIVISIAIAFSFNIAYLAVTRFAFGLFLAAVGPSATAILSKSVPNNFRSRVLSINSSFSQLGAAIGPMLGGAIAGFWGLNIVFIFTAVGLLAVIFWLRTVTIDLSKPLPIGQKVAVLKENKSR